MREPEQPFKDFRGKKFVLLTTFRKDGTPVPTPLDCYLIDDRLFLVTDRRTGKVKRLRHNPNVTVAPCTISGAPMGPTVCGRVRILGVEEAIRICEAFALARPIVYRLGRFAYRLRHKHALYLEVLPAQTRMLIHGTESDPFARTNQKRS
ncbi:MAG: PPOX class F420-dependent oxidoreductase [Actinomycetota bacterium]